MIDAFLSFTRSGAMPITLSAFLTATRYGSKPQPNSCHQTFSQGGRTKIEFHLKLCPESLQYEAMVSKLSFAMV